MPWFNYLCKRETCAFSFCGSNCILSEREIVEIFIYSPNACITGSSWNVFIKNGDLRSKRKHLFMKLFFLCVLWVFSISTTSTTCSFMIFAYTCTVREKKKSRTRAITTVLKLVKIKLFLLNFIYDFLFYTALIIWISWKAVCEPYMRFSSDKKY